MSSIPVINKVGHSSSGLRKTVWLMILIVGIFQSGLRINRFLHLYFQYPVVISLDIKEERNLFFPAVTFCNLNRMNFMFELCIANGTKMQFCKSHFEVEEGIPIPERRLYSPGEKYCSSLHKGQPLNDVSKMNNFIKRFSSETEENRKRLGYQSYELIRECTFDGTVCSSDNFTQIQSLQYGNCYTFNSIGSRKSLKSRNFGTQSGLQVLLSINPYSYMHISQTLGAKVIIHNPEEVPDIDERGVTITPGFETSIALSQTVHERLPSPYRDHCVNYQKGAKPGQKSQMECIKTCIQNVNNAICGCLDPTMLKIDNFTLCNISNVIESCCLDEVLRKFASKENACDCPLACSKVFYNEQLSMSVWPSEKLILGTKVFTKNESLWPDQNMLEFIREGYARVRIFYSTFKRSTSSQKPMFQQSELYSYLGGELGLWLGLSVSSLFEMLEQFLNMLKCVILKISPQFVK